MKTIIAGSRTITDHLPVRKAIAQAQAKGLVITEVVSGGARGTDTLGEQWAYYRGIPVKRFNADWDRYGRSAGYRRNEQMARYAEALVAVWDGTSPGTRHMIELARRLGLRVHVYIVEGD